MTLMTFDLVRSACRYCTARVKAVPPGKHDVCLPLKFYVAFESLYLAPAINNKPLLVMPPTVCNVAQAIS